MQNSLKNPDSKIKKKRLQTHLCCYCCFCWDILTFRQVYPTSRQGCRSTNNNNSDQKKKTIQDPESKIQKSRLRNRNSKNKKQNPKSRIQNWKPKKPIPKSKILKYENPKNPNSNARHLWYPTGDGKIFQNKMLPKRSPRTLVSFGHTQRGYSKS